MTDTAGAGAALNAAVLLTELPTVEELGRREHAARLAALDEARNEVIRGAQRVEKARTHLAAFQQQFELAQAALAALEGA